MKKFFSTFFALLIGIALILAGLHSSYQNLLILSDSISTQGVITKVTQAEHYFRTPYKEHLRITFRDFAGKEHKFEENMLRAFRSQGQAIKVNYYKSDPSLATVSDNYENVMFGVVTIMIGTGLLAIALIPIIKSLGKR